MDDHSGNIPNRLANSKSPYLKQHAYNPVDWYPWGDEALNKAADENKPILLSIGYSSCHWCHVMAHESFENDSIAAYMNEHFVNIKLDREERPDIDQIYMDAVQAMGLRGGWPLNVFLTPEQKPFYGGTYFPAENWTKLLSSIVDAYQNNFDKLNESAEQFAASIKDNYTEKYGLGQNIQNLILSDFEKSNESLIDRFDHQWGGLKKSPKFPMPSVWMYLFHLSHYTDDPDTKKHVFFTLDKIMDGGIYDQIGGGFSRYSVDEEWHVPHFEKMLYDNGQLMSLYAVAYKESKKEKYKNILVETATWLEREMTNSNGGFYSALDADSEGEEGKFYVWEYDEFSQIAGSNTQVLAAYYDVSIKGNWEENNVLRKLETPEDIASRFSISQEELSEIVSQFKKEALNERSKRERPGLDDKIIAGWNGLMLTGLLHAYQATQEEQIKELCIRNGQFIKDSLIVDNQLIRTLGTNTEGFLEDYSAVIQAFITYYETFGDEVYLNTAKKLVDKVLADFIDPDEALFYYSSLHAEELITRKKELFDNVIPSSNALMADNLFRLGNILYNKTYSELASNMIDQVSHLLIKEPEYMSHWATTAMNMLSPTAQIVIVGDEYRAFQDSINAHFIPEKVCLAAKKDSKLSLFEFKEPIQNQTTVYLCYDNTCKRPVFTAAETLSLINE